ncbi:MAG TPA: hypothetical protein VFQ75_00855 [Candidatus Limnocylindrales bacterium]|nr:hypothetical protein [Candidatus Limnocylindrales bacterium]
MDPAVLGTLRIGLDAIEAESRDTDRLRAAARRRARPPRIRAAFAVLLRRTADLLEPRIAGETPSQAR